MDYSALLILLFGGFLGALFGGLVGWLFRRRRYADELAAHQRNTQYQHQLKAAAADISDARFELRQLRESGEIYSEVGELYQLVAKVKPLQYQLLQLRNTNHSLASDKEQAEKRLHSQLKKNQQLQKTHKLELAQSSAKQLAEKEARIAELQDMQLDLTADLSEQMSALRSADSTASVASDNVVSTSTLVQEKQQLLEENTVLQSELKTLQLQGDKQYADLNGVVSAQKIELHTVQLQLEDRQIQLSNANKRLAEIGQLHAVEAEAVSTLQQASTSKDEQIGQLRTQLDESSQAINAAVREKEDAIGKADNYAQLVVKAETRSAELQVQQTQAEQQWRYEMSSLQSATTKLNDTKAKACEKIAALERTVSQGHSQRLVLESRLKTAEAYVEELDQALEKSECSSQSFSEYSQIAEAKVIQLSNVLSERDAEIEKTRDSHRTLTHSLGQAEQENATLVTKAAAAEARAYDLNTTLTLQRTNALALEKQSKELEASLHKAHTSLKEKHASLSNFEQKRLSDAHKINELQALLSSAESRASESSRDSIKIERLEAQILQLKNETNKYARFQQDAQATALELLEAKESLKKLDTQSRIARDASARLTTSNIEITRLQKELAGAKRFQLELREQGAVLAKLKSEVKQTTDMQNALDEQKSLVSTLQHEIHARDAAIQSAQAQKGEDAKHDSDRIDQATEALTQSKKQITELSTALSKAESVTKQATQNDLELRRLKSELQSLQADRNTAAQSLDGKPLSSAALKALEQGIVRRDKQIEQLKRRLTELQSQTAAAVVQKSASTPQTVPTTPKSRAPALYAVPKQKDDLKRIKGIGPVMEKTLNELGITSFKQIAGFTQADIERVSDAIATFPGRIERDDWVGGAKKQFKIKYQNHAEA